MALDIPSPEGNILTGFGEMEEYLDSEGQPRLGVLIKPRNQGTLSDFCVLALTDEGKRFKQISFNPA